MNNMKKSLEEQSERMQKFNSEQIALHEKNKTEEDLNESVSRMVKVLTEFHLRVTEYDATGYYYPTYSTNVIVIAETLEDAKKKALERTPKKQSGYDWQQRVSVLSSKDVVICDTEERSE